MFWENNRKALLQANPSQRALLDRLAQTSATTAVELVATEDEDYTLLYQGIPLHAISGALKEAAEITQQHCKPGLGRVHLVLGMGLGYVMEAVYRNSPGQVLVYEPDAGLLRFVLDNVDLTEFLSSGRITLETNSADLLTLLNPYMACEDPLDILLTPGYATLLAPEIPLLMDALFAMAEERLRDYRTGQHFHFQWIRQFFQNLPYFPQTKPFKALAGKFPNRPALIIGRGPSLDTALEDIRTLSDAMVLIAAGGALHRLHQEGIAPDFAVFYDANGMQEQLNGLPESYLQQITFLINAFTEPVCLTAPAKDKILFFPQNGEALAEWWQGCQSLEPANPATTPANTETPLLLEGGGTVSLMALQAAIAMQCNPIVLVGQDLAFPNNQVYAGGIPLATDAQGRMALTSSETLFAAPEALTTVIGQTGEQLPALKAYASFIRHFERIAMAHPEIQLLNASIGGAKLDGYRLTPLSTLKNTFLPWKTPDRLNFLDSTTQLASQAQRLEAICAGLSRLKHVLYQAVELYETLLQPNSTPEASNQPLFELLNANPFLSHCLMFEMMETQRRYDPNTTSPQAVTHNQALLKQNRQNCLDILRNQILPWVITAETSLMKDFDKLAIHHNRKTDTINSVS